MTQERKQRAAAIVGIVVLVIAACFVGRKIVRAVTPTVWTVTQFASTKSTQIMFYTIEDNKGHFVIIDGGLWEDAEIVWGEILKHKRHIDAWIVTHPHADHAGAFNNLMQSPPLDFKIDKIYMPKVNKEAYENQNDWWDDIGVYYLQEELTRDLPNVEYPKENDVIDLIGLKMQIIHTWDACTDEQTHELPNNGSMMFKLSGSEQSMLFCADMLIAMEQIIIQAHGEELKADYVQCGHHGNNSLSHEFYELVDPSVAFFDCPKWLLDNTDKYTANELRNWFEEKGVKVLSFETAPNQVEIR